MRTRTVSSPIIKSSIDVSQFNHEQIDVAQIKYNQVRRLHWNEIACKLETWTGWGGYYHRRLTQVYQSLVAPGQSVLELGCARGDLLNALRPAVGVGVDFSEDMLRSARRRHSHLRFVQSDAHTLNLSEKFDVIILSDLVNDLWDVETVLKSISRFTTPRTRIIINFYSHLWEPILKMAELVGLATPNLHQNWLTAGDITGLLNLADCEVIKQSQEILLPLPVPILGELCNRFLVKLWPFKHFALTNFIVARPRPWTGTCAKRPSVSVIVPARNEEGNIPDIFARTPEMGKSTEIIFVDGNSTDGTIEAIERHLRSGTRPGMRPIIEFGRRQRFDHIEKSRIFLFPSADEELAIAQLCSIALCRHKNSNSLLRPD